MDSPQALNHSFRLDTALLRFDAVVRREVLLPAYSGSTLRGAWGHALRAQSCTTGLIDCKACPARSRCVYTAAFETLPQLPAHNGQKLSEAPRPYVLHPPSWGEQRLREGERFSFHQLLIGPAIEQAELLSHAWHTALGKRIGDGNGCADLLTVSQIGSGGMRMLYGNGLGPFLPASAEACESQRIPATFGLEFFTPLRMQSQGSPLQLDALTPKRFLSALLRRVRLLAQHHGQGDPIQDDDMLFAQLDGVQDAKDLRWTDWQRSSSRQQRKISLGGYTGTWRWTLAGPPDAALAGLLSLGQLLHVGKETTFGMGGFRITS